MQCGELKINVGGGVCRDYARRVVLQTFCDAYTSTRSSITCFFFFFFSTRAAAECGEWRCWFKVEFFSTGRRLWGASISRRRDFVTTLGTEALGTEAGDERTVVRIATTVWCYRPTASNAELLDVPRAVEECGV